MNVPAKVTMHARVHKGEKNIELLGISTGISRVNKDFSGTPFSLISVLILHFNRVTRIVLFIRPSYNKYYISIFLKYFIINQSIKPRYLERFVENKRKINLLYCQTPANKNVTIPLFFVSLAPKTIIKEIFNFTSLLNIKTKIEEPQYRC